MTPDHAAILIDLALKAVMAGGVVIIIVFMVKDRPKS